MSAAEPLPTVSVVMAAYNGAALIAETLTSLGRQTLTDFEAIVVDDCSTDTTREVVAAWPDPRVRLIAAPVNGGPVRARNLAFAAARGRYIAGLDHDDLCHPERLARQVAYLDANPGTVLVGTAARVIENGAVHAPRLPANSTPALIGWLLHVCNPLVWSSVMIRGSVARALDPPTRPELTYAEDFDLYHRLRPHGAIARIDEELTFYRSHAGGASQRHTDTMIARAGDVLATTYRPILGDEGEAAARLIAAHVMAHVPVPDRSTLIRLGAVLMTLQQAYFADALPGRDDRKLIRWETARLWWRVARRAVRFGSLSLADVVAVRPDHLGLGHAPLDDLVVSGLVGQARRLRARS